MENKKEVSRRSFLASGASAVSGLVVAFYLPGGTAARLAPNGKPNIFAPNAFLNIHPDSRITIWVTRSEMGQGVRTALPMMLAEELEADWSKIEIQQASPGAAFKGIRLQTAGSGSIYGTWIPLRKAGAAAREMLLTAAANRWKVPIETCRAENGNIFHDLSRRRLSYGELSTSASRLSVPKNPQLKDPGDYRLIGKPMKRFDGPEIVSGKAVYGLDVKVPGMRHAVIAHAPVLGAEAIRWDDRNTKSVPGVLAVVAVTKGIQKGVAVVADNLWSAMKGRQALSVDWNEGKGKDFSSVSFNQQLRAALEEEGFTTRHEGDFDRSYKEAATRMEAIYEYPFQVHAPLETMNCVADVRKDSCEIWASTQNPEAVYNEVAKMLGIKPESVKVNVPLLGGGFGRRLFADYVYETVEISRAVKSPVQVVWTRVDDTKHGFFHSSTICRMQAGFDADKNLTGISHKTASSDLSMFGPPDLNLKKYIEGWNPWGAYDSPYALPSYRVDYVHVDSPVPTGAWRSVDYPQNVFARECFIDEVAFQIGQDPLEFRLGLLDADPAELFEMKIQRRGLRKVLKIAAEKAGWTKPLPREGGRRWGRGVACNVYHGGSLMSQIAEVSVDDKNQLRVHRIICVTDCGQVINPLGLEGQIESGIVWGLSAALRGEITFKNGKVEQNNYTDFEVLRMNEMPKIEIYTLPSKSRPFGMGEPPVPPVAPAVANAIFDATGKRCRKIPFERDVGLKKTA